MQETGLKLKKEKKIRKITKIRLKNIGLYYLKRFETSVANLRSVLKRRVMKYAYHDSDFDIKEAERWIEELLEDFQRLGYINDERYCEMKIKSYLAAGKSPRYIIGKLREKGINESIAECIIAEQEFNPYDAAIKLARKKRIGPYCVDEKKRKERYAKDLAVLIRAGFDYDIAVEVLQAEAD